MTNEPPATRGPERACGCRRCSPSPRAARRRSGRSGSRRARTRAPGRAPSRRAWTGPAPGRPTAISVWTEPGRSTTTTRARRRPRAPGRPAGSAGRWRGADQVPRVPSSTPTTSTPVRSPATTTVAPCGPTAVAWNSTRSSRVSAPMVSVRAAGGAAGPVVGVPQGAGELLGRAVGRRRPAPARSRRAGCAGCGAPRPRGRPGSAEGLGDQAPPRCARWRWGTSTSTSRPPSETPAPSTMPCRSISSANSSEPWASGALVEQPGGHGADALLAGAARPTARWARRRAATGRTGRAGRARARARRCRARARRARGRSRAGRGDVGAGGAHATASSVGALGCSASSLASSATR